MVVSRRETLCSLFALPLAPIFVPPGVTRAAKLIRSARKQIGVTKSYDGAYVRLAYPGGDVPIESGVCIDVVIRAYRDAFEVDFQKLVHEDMRTAFSAYPKTWELTRPDRNIDHRRVPNLETWLTRHGHELHDENWQPGDILTCRVPPNLPHTAIVSDRRGYDGQFKVIHNIGRGAREESLIGRFDRQRRFRFLPG